jgi:hypothetical protein
MLKFNILLVPLLGLFGIVGPSVASCFANGRPAGFPYRNANGPLVKQNSQKKT